MSTVSSCTSLWRRHGSENVASDWRRHLANLQTRRYYNNRYFDGNSEREKLAAGSLAYKKNCMHVTQ